MGSIKLIGQEELANIPWEDRPAGEKGPIWRYSSQPGDTQGPDPDVQQHLQQRRRPLRRAASRACSAATTGRGGWSCTVGFSDDGLNWDIATRAVGVRQPTTPRSVNFVYGYDPRVVRIEDRYYVTWCNWYHGPTIGVAWTDDFATFHQEENAFLPFNRNGVLFPRKVNGRFAMLSRPSDNGHTPFGDVFYSESPDLCFWGRHRHVMSPVANSWQATKVGGGPVPIETSEGWLLIYHGVLTSCNGYVYSAGVALLDLDEPWKVMARSTPYILSPQASYECVGDVANVVFPCAMLCDEPDAAGWRSITARPIR